MSESSSHAQAPSLCYMTPTFARDIEHFALLRRSVRLFSPNIPHLVYVDTEDYQTFVRRFGNEPLLQIIPMADILPPRMERERRFWKSWRGGLADRVNHRVGSHNRLFTGWKVQQILKLEAAARVPFDAVVFLDSDCFFCDTVEPHDFTRGGDLILLETPATNYEDFAFEVSRQVLTAGSLLEPADAFNYIHQAPRFLRRTAERLLEHLQSRYANWHTALFREMFPSEYNLLGYAARVLEEYRGYQRAITPRQEWLYEVKLPHALDQQIDLCHAENGRRKFFLIQSNMRIPAADYVPRATRMIEHLAQQRHRVDRVAASPLPALAGSATTAPLAGLPTAA